MNGLRVKPMPIISEVLKINQKMFQHQLINYKLLRGFEIIIAFIGGTLALFLKTLTLSKN